MSEYQSDQIGDLAQALASAQGKITFALKECSAPVFEKGGQARGQRKYADLQSVIDAIKAPLSENGLAYVQSVLPSENGVNLRTTLMHTSGQWIASQMTLPIDRMGGIQGMGSALTYARRYALSALVGVAPDEDDDGQAAQDAGVKRTQTKPAPAKRENAPQRPAQSQEMAQPQMTAELKAKAGELWEALGNAGFQSREDRLHEISRRLGKPISKSQELTLDDCNAVLWSLNNPEPSEKDPEDKPF